MNESKRILVTGASGEIGSALTNILCVKGHRVGFHSRNKKNNDQKFLQLSKKFGDSIRELNYDFCKSSEAKKCIRKFCTFWNGIDALVMLHGDSKSKEMKMLTQKVWEETLQINLISSFFLARTAMEQMQVSKVNGRILFTSTASAKFGGGGKTLPYGVAKIGQETLVKSLAKVGAEDNILVNAVAPGYINTSFHTKRLRRTQKELREREKLIPLKRAGTCDEVAKTIEFLLFDSSTYITGQTLSVCGGDWL
jgi:3-oxoacyl-[acyl-carrier protein] reductase